MAFIISIANQKGGVAKTTTSECFGAALHQKGYRVLVVDLDAQGNLSMYAGAKGVKDAEYPGIANVLRRECKMRDSIQHLPYFDVSASNKDAMSNIETDLSQKVMEGLMRLKKALNTVSGDYDVIILDCPPNLGLLVSSALIASDVLLIPAECETGSIEGIQGVADLLKDAKEDFNPELRFAGVLRTRVKPRKNNHKVASAEIEQKTRDLGCHLYEAEIRESVRLQEEHDLTKNPQGANIMYDNPQSTVAQDYLAFTDEFIRMFEEGGE